MARWRQCGRVPKVVRERPAAKASKEPTAGSLQPVAPKAAQGAPADVRMHFPLSAGSVVVVVLGDGVAEGGGVGVAAAKAEDEAGDGSGCEGGGNGRGLW